MPRPAGVGIKSFGRSGRPSTSGSSRPSTAQSTTGLITAYGKDVEREKKRQYESGAGGEISYPAGTALGSPLDGHQGILDIGQGSNLQSAQYLNYRNSLSSLKRIIDNVCGIPNDICDLLTSLLG